jgi:hypothetical protein
MTHRLEDIGRTIEEALPITTVPAERGLRLEIAGVDASLELAIGQEFTVFADSWHEHFATRDELMAFLQGLVCGALHVVVTYQGSRAVAYQIVEAGNGAVKIRSSGGALLRPWWRQRNEVVVSYKGAQRGNRQAPQRVAAPGA